MFDENDEDLSKEEIYTDGTARFTLETEEDKLTWEDGKEDAAKGMKFERGEIEELTVEVDEEVEEAEDAEEDEKEN